jgi:hypothetical protein
MPTSCRRPAISARVRGVGAGLRQVVTDRRAARAAQRVGPTPSGLAEWLADRQQQPDLHAERAPAGAVAERRVAETLCSRATSCDPAAGSTATRRPTGRATGRTRSITANPRMTSATVGHRYGHAPSASAGPMIGRCRSRRRTSSPV